MAKLKKEVHGVPQAKMGNLKEHWEHHYDSNFRKETGKRLGSEFNPKCPGERMTTYSKVNETDT